MKQKELIFLILFLPVCLSGQVNTRDSSLSLSLNEAIQYALANSPLIKSAQLDVESARKKIWETTAIGLPQVNAKYNYSYIITLPEIYKQFAMMGAGQGGTPVNLDDLRTTSTLDITVSQLIFSGSYLVGLQTSKVYKSLSELSLVKTEQDLKERITNTYILVLITRENKRLYDSIYILTSNLLENQKSLFAQGLLDETDVSQLEVNTNMLKNNVEFLSNQLQVVERLLKFQLGYPIDNAIIMKDSLQNLLPSITDESVLLRNFNFENQVDFQLLESQKKLMKLNHMLNKSAFLPEIAGFYQHDKNFNTKAITFTPPDLIGISINIPIFSSGMRIARVSQARLGYEKAVINQQQLRENLLISYEDTKSRFIYALQNYRTSYANYKLSEKIYQRSVVKYKEGIISSFELTQIQNQYIQAQAKYYDSIMELNKIKVNFEKITTSIR